MSARGRVFSPHTSISSCSIIPPVFDTHASLAYHQSYILATDSVVVTKAQRRKRHLKLNVLPFQTAYRGLAGVTQVPRARHLHHVAVKPDKTPCDLKSTGGIACIHQPARYEYTKTVPQFNWTTFSNTRVVRQCCVIHTAPDVKEVVMKNQVWR